MSALFIGLMSGTSLDGIDGVIVDFAPADGSAGIRVVAHAKRAFAPVLRGQLAALNRSGDDEIHRAALAANALARDYAALVETLCASAALARDRIVAIGCHGQTVRHRPGEFDGTGYTVQLNAPALLAELTGIDVIADFRSRDVAAGGQGAPLVPAFHRALFGRADATVAVLNLGGIANLTVLGQAAARRPASTAARPTPCSTSGASARRAAPSTPTAPPRRAATSTARLLDALLAEPYFALAPPKSTGLDLFNAALARRPPRRGRGTRPVARRRRPGDARRAHRARRRHCLPPPCRRSGRADRLRRRRLQRRPDGAAGPIARADAGRGERCARAAARPGRGDGVRLAGARVRRAPGGQRRRRRPAPPVRVCSARCTPPADRAPPRKKPPGGGFVRRLAATQAEKLEPQPQVVVAFGFLITNWAPCRSSL